MNYGIKIRNILEYLNNKKITKGKMNIYNGPIGNIKQQLEL